MLPGVALCNVLHIVRASDKVIVTEWALPQIGAAVNEAAQVASRWLKETAAQGDVERRRQR